MTTELASLECLKIDVSTFKIHFKLACNEDIYILNEFKFQLE